MIPSFGAYDRASNEIRSSVSILDMTRSNKMLHYAEDDKNIWHTMTSFEITSAEMDMVTPWLACEVKRGESISVIDKELPRHIESALW